MTRHLPPAACAGLLLVCAAGLSGCGSAPTHFFTLDPVAPAGSPASAYAGPPIKVLAVNIPPSLDRQELISETSLGEVKVHDFEHWAAPLGQTARQALVQDLAARLPAGTVLGPASPGGPGVATLSVDVVAFHAGPQGAIMQVSWSATLPSLAGGTMAGVVRGALQQLQAPGVSADGQGTAQAFSALLAELSDQIAASLPGQLQAAMQVQAEAAALAEMQARTQTRTQVRTTTRTTVAHPF